MQTVFESENFVECGNFLLKSGNELSSALNLKRVKQETTETEENYMNYSIDLGLSKKIEDIKSEIKKIKEIKNGEAPVENKEYQYGVTDPITLNYPLKEDLKKTNDVLELLKGYDLFETESGLKKREKVLGMINKLFHEFIINLSLNQGINEEEAKQIHGNLYTFGSYRLGVITPNSDIDCIFLAPRNLTREIFFNEFYNKLKEDRNVEKLQALPETYTPIIQFMYDGVDIDLLLATLPYRTLKDCQYSLDDDNILKNLDDVTVRSLNGIRVADLILKHVPNKECFRNTLRFIKLWATNRGIYSNILGFLGGISWALLTARICQLYPNYTTSQLICKFFQIYSIWNWNCPVILKKIKKYATEGLKDFLVWDPEKNIKDKYHVMPIITPAFPSMNSTHNVTYCTRSIIIEEFKRAFAISTGKSVDNAGIDNGNTDDKNNMNYKNIDRGSSNVWNKILQPLDIFKIYKHFLHFQIMATNELTHSKWKGWIESKIRFLFKKLESMNKLKIRPYPKFYFYKKGEYCYCSSFFIALIFFTKNTNNKKIDFSSAIMDFLDIMKNWPDKNKYTNTYKLNISYQRQPQVIEFLESVNLMSKEKESCDSFNEKEKVNEKHNIKHMVTKGESEEKNKEEVRKETGKEEKEKEKGVTTECSEVIINGAVIEDEL